MKEFVVTSMNITRDEKKIVLNLLVKSFSVLLTNFNLVRLICKLKGEPVLSVHDFHKRKSTCKSPRTRVAL